MDFEQNILSKLLIVAIHNLKMSNKGEQTISFSFNGMSIIYPFYCECMEKRVNPFEYYGKENCIKLIKDYELNYSF